MTLIKLRHVSCCGFAPGSVHVGFVVGKEVRGHVLPNIVVEWLTLLLRIREVPGSNLGPQTGHTD
jgi:hypothetical protein